MAHKIISSSLCEVIVCSNEGQEAALKWTNSNWKCPVKEEVWELTYFQRKCNCWGSKAISERKAGLLNPYIHYIFGCLFLRKSNDH